jgi:hypothetical protein
MDEMKAQLKSAHLSVTEEMKKEATDLAGEFKQLKKHNKAASASHSAAKKKLAVLRSERGKPKDGFAAKQDKAMQTAGADRAVYHGGDVTGVGARALMGNSHSYHGEVKNASIAVKDQEHCKLTDEEIGDVYDKYTKMYLLADEIFSLLRGINPTKEELDRLEKSIKLCRKIWVDELGISCTPKMHILFDGHEFEQHKRLKGIGDKEEDFVEKGHQGSIRDDRRTWCMRNWENQQRSQVLYNCRGNQHDVKKIISDVQQSKKRKLARLENGGLSLKEERKQVNYEVKKEKRDVNYADSSIRFTHDSEP